MQAVTLSGHSNPPTHRTSSSAFGVCHLVDEQGREIRITETMIMNACEALRRRCHLPNKS